MRPVTKHFFACTLLLICLQSCGGMETVVSVYPDGSAQLSYNLEAPIGKLPDFEAMGKGQFGDLFKKDALLSQEPKQLIDSLVEFGVRPLLLRLKNSGQISGYSITDSAEFTSKKVKIAIDLASYADIGRTHGTFRREIPVLDSIVRKLTNRSAAARPDSIAVVSLGDSLELQLHHFMIEPMIIETTREERIAKANVMLDSMLNIFSDTTSFLAFFSRAELTKMTDSLKLARLSMTDDQLDSMGQEMINKTEMGDALFKPKISLRAPVTLANNSELLNGRINVQPKNGGLEFEPSTPYGEITNVGEPVRQWFKLKLPQMRSMDQSERDEWRGILKWCEECENAYQSNPSKLRKENITFTPVTEGYYLLEVDCGMIGSEKAKMFYSLELTSKMPIVGLHQFSQAFYIDDPASEFRSGAPRFIRRKADMLVGKVAYDKKEQTITVDRPSSKETFTIEFHQPEHRSGKYKDKSGKWLTIEAYGMTNATDLYESQLCTTGVQLSSEIPFEPPPVSMEGLGD